MVRISAVLLALSLESAVFAQPAPDSGAADIVFREGLQLRDAGDVARACTKFEAARDLDPTSGTLLVLADCYERLGRSASAYSAFADAVLLADKEQRADRANEAKRRQALLEPQLTRIALVIKTPVADLKISRDGRDIPPSVYATPLPVDPGDHEIVARSEGFKPWSAHITARTAGVITVDVPPLEALPASPPPPEPTPMPVAPPRVVPPTPVPVTTAVVPPAASPVAQAETNGSARRPVGVVLTVAGVAGIGAGMYFGYVARRDWNDASSHCSADTVCDQRGYDLANNANHAARIADIAIGAGAAVGILGGRLVGHGSQLVEARSPGAAPFATARPQLHGPRTAGGVLMRALAVVSALLILGGCERVLGLSQPTLDGDAGVTGGADAPMLSCTAPMKDCNAKPADGCEIDLDNDVNNCGACGHKCSQAGGTTSCSGGMCVVSACSAGRDNCNGVGDDGCEASLSSPQTCGDCNTACAVPPNASATCTQAGCGFACGSGFLDCTADPGCESSITAQATCGSCTHDCGGGSCSAGTCGYYEVVPFDYRGGHFLVDDAYVYVATGHGTAEILRFPKAGGTPTTVFTGGASLYALDGNYLYFFSGGAKRVAKDGTGAVDDIPNVPQDAIKDGQKFFWMEDSGNVASIFSTNLDGSAKTTVRTIDHTGSMLWRGRLSAGSGYLFVMSMFFSNNVYGISVAVYSGSDGSSVSGTGWYRGSVEWQDMPIVTDGTYYYFGITPNGGTGGTVVRNNIITGATKTLPATAFDALATYGANVYFRDSSGHILKADTSFTSTSTIATFTAGPPVNVVLDDTSVYWFDSTNWPIYRQVL